MPQDADSLSTQDVTPTPPKGYSLILSKSPAAPKGIKLPSGYKLIESKAPAAQKKTVKELKLEAAKLKPVVPPSGYMLSPNVETPLHQIRNAVANSAIGHSIEQTMPKVATALNLHPSETVNSPTYQQHKDQLLAPEYVTSAISDQLGLSQPNEERLEGVLRAAGGFTTAPSLAMIATGPLAAPTTVASATLSRLVSGGFTLDMLHGLYQQHKEYRKAVDSGNMDEAHKIQGEMGVTGVMALLTGKHALTKHPFTPVTEPVSRERTNVLHRNTAGEVRQAPGQAPSVWLSPSAWESFMGTLYPHENAAETHGVNLPANEHLHSFANEPQLAAANPQFGEVQKLLAEAHKNAGEGGVAIAKQRPSVQSNVNVMREELNHTWQRGLTGKITDHLSPEGFNTMYQAIPSGLYDHLLEHGYSGYNSPEMVAEAAVRMMDGRPEKFGVTNDEAVDFLDKYFKEVTDKHGAKALEELQHVRGVAADAKARAIEEHAGRTGAGQDNRTVPSVGVGGQGGVGEGVPAEGQNLTPAAEQVPGTMAISDITAHPDYQFDPKANPETGLVEPLTGKYNPDRAGKLTVWKNPEDGKTYLVHGFHRFDLAKRSGVENVATENLPESEVPDLQGRIQIKAWDKENPSFNREKDDPDSQMALFRQMGEKLKEARNNYSANKPETVAAYNEALRNYEFSSPSFMKKYMREQMGQIQKPGDVADVQELERMSKLGETLFNREKDKPVWYLKSEKLIGEKMRGPMPGQDVSKMLIAGGVKPEEMHWTGLDDFLKSKGKDKVTPEEIKEHLANNNIQIKEVTKGSVNIPKGQYLVFDADDKIVGAEDTPEAAKRAANAIGEGASWTDRDDAAGRHALATGGGGATKYGSYVIPGGENYRETLLTMPPKPPLDLIAQRDALAAKTSKLGDEWLDLNTNRVTLANARSGKDISADMARMKEIESEQGAIQKQIDEIGKKIRGDGSSFRSSHWDEPNILAHVRHNDRSSLTYTPEDIKRIEAKIQEAMPNYGPKSWGSGATGLAVHKGLITPEEAAQYSHAKGWNNDTKAAQRRLLHVEEVQSDWHQNGRDVGYEGDYKPLTELPQGYSVKSEKMDNGDEMFWVSDPEGKRITARSYNKQGSINEALNALNDKERGTTASPVPDAPFKKTWHEMALRRMLQHAVANNYDALSWTPGEDQAERYSLSHQVDKIAVPMVKADGSRSVRIDPIGGGHDSFKMMVSPDGTVDGSYNASQFTGKKLDDVIGKEMAKKVMEAKEPVDFSGEGLKVGGSGMTGFYDKIVPDYLNKFGKKYGSKVGETEIPVTEKWAGNKRSLTSSIENDPRLGKMDLYATVDSGGNWTGITGDKNGPFLMDGEHIVHVATADGKLTDEVEKLEKAKTDRKKVQYLPITPEMRKSVTEEGVPLFNRDNTQSDIEHWTNYSKNTTFDTEQEARDWTFRRKQQSDEQYGDMFGRKGEAANRAFADSLPIRKEGKKFKIGAKIKTPVSKKRFGEHEPEGTAPAVDWYDQDLQDSGKTVDEASILRDYGGGKPAKVYRSYVDPSILEPKLAEDQGRDNEDGGSYDWESLEMTGGRKPVPPAKILIKQNGKVEISDGNHRIKYWQDKRFDSIPAWIIDRRKGININKKDALFNREQVKTPEFKKFFGDSKIVDEDGEPLTVYHGTTRDFDTFRKTDQHGNDYVHYFTPSSNYTSFFSNAPGGRTIPAYIKMENPYYTDSSNDIEGAGQYKDWIKELKEKGHDGIIYSKKGDITKGPSGWGDDVPQYAVFDPKQIKSSIGNSGAFDPNDPNILRNREKITKSENFKDWFGDWEDKNAYSSKRDVSKPSVSMAVNDDGSPRVFYHGTQGDFDTFEANRPSKNTGLFGIPYDATRAGIFFATDPKHTMDWMRDWDKRGNEKVAKDSKTLPVYLNIKSPIDLDGVLKGVNPLDEDARDEFAKEGINPRWFNSVQHSWELFDDEDGKAFVAAAKKLGYDGATIKEDDLDGNSHDVWVAFEPNQIKSAIGNSGKFSPDDPSILRNREKPSSGQESSTDLDVNTNTEVNAENKPEQVAGSTGTAPTTIIPVQGGTQVTGAPKQEPVVPVPTQEHRLAYKNGPTFGSPFGSKEDAEKEIKESYPGRDDIEIRAGDVEPSPKAGTYYRGTEPGETKRISTGDSSWDSHLFAADQVKHARNYGRSIEEIQLKSDAKVLVEGSKEFKKLVGGYKSGESTLSYSSRAAKLAKAAGYDIVHFKMQGDVGTAIMNTDAIESRKPYTSTGTAPVSVIPIQGGTQLAAAPIQVPPVPVPTKKVLPREQVMAMAAGLNPKSQQGQITNVRELIRLAKSRMIP
jgi:hypothetical protein